jgi:hypothetical protein
MINLFVEYFKHPDPIRDKEIKIAMLTSIDIVDRVSNVSLYLPERATFQDIFEYANLVSKPDDINILINADIMLTRSFREINPGENDFFCISRWEPGAKHPFRHERGDSQDVWVWRGKTRVKNCDFYLGILGCDNRVAYEAKKAGYRVTNPAYRYRAYHNHRSGVRTHKGKRLPKPYRLVKPT